MYNKFKIWKKIISFENNTSMGVVWFRSCSLLLIVSVVIYWGCTMYGNILGVNYKWVVQVVKTTAGLGMALNVANIAPAFIVGFADQIKRVAVSSVVTLILVCLLVPFLTALIWWEKLHMELFLIWKRIFLLKSSEI